MSLRQSLIEQSTSDDVRKCMSVIIRILYDLSSVANSSSKSSLNTRKGPVGKDKPRDGSSICVHASSQEEGIEPIVDSTFHRFDRAVQERRGTGREA